MDFQDDELKEIFHIFRIESEEILERLNSSLLVLEKNPTNKELIVKLFRDAHNLKGATRMVRFINVQNIAHKMEDILGLIKDNELNLNSEIIDALYSSIDLISKIINKSNKDEEIVDDQEVKKHIILLDNTKIQDDKTSNPSDNGFNKAYFVQNADRINYLVIDILISIIKLTEQIDAKYLQKIYENTEELIEHFHIINYYEIISELEDIYTKLKVIIKCNTQLSYDEVERFQQRADVLVTIYTNLCQNNDIPVIDVYSYAFDGRSYEKGAEKFNQETSNLEVVNEIPTNNIRTSTEKFNFDDIKIKIDTLSSTTKHIQELLTKFTSLNELYAQTDFAPLLVKITEVIDFLKKVNIKMEDIQLEILRNCSNYCFARINNEETSDNMELLIQQLTVIQQLIEIANPIPITEVTQTQNIEKTQEKTNKKNKISNTSEIKTIHVASNKLDEMANKISELISAKTSSTKSLDEISNFKKTLENWQKDFSKLIHHFKTFDKKQLGQNNAFIKQLILSLAEQNQNLNSIINELNQIQHTNIEYDLKVRLLIDDLKKMVQNVRIMPLATVFHLFGRMVRDIAKENNKEIELTITGSETSADKKIIEEIKNPLIHIIRNSADHGIEMPEERKTLGKTSVGHIQINARHQENFIIIEVIDDGRGFDIEKIKEKAISNGLFSLDEINKMSEKEIMDIVFVSGFSTSDDVSNLSGRGMGMDIVKTSIAQLNGTINIISEFHKGTKIEIKLPVSMATMNALILKTSSQTFAIPMDSISTVVCKRSEELIKNQDTLNILYEGKNIPLTSLANLLNLENSIENSTFKTILILKQHDKTIGLIVDKLLGEQEIILKPLAPPLYKLKNISGITTLANGETCLILDTNDLIESSSNTKYFSNTKQQLLENKEDK